MTISFPNLRDRATEALQQLVPEAPRVVIAMASELPETHRGAGLAYTGKDLDLALRPLLGFEGRAVCMVIEDAVLLENQTEHAQSRRMVEPTPAMLRGTFLEAVCHEVGHIVVNDWVPSPGDPEPPGATITTRVEQLCEGGPNIRTGADLVVPFASHNGKWIRVYLHVCYRLSESIMPICPSTDPFHRVSSARKYQLALGDEPARLAGVALRDIGDIGPPESFIKQWQTDVSNWWLALPHANNENTAMLRAWQSLFEI